jgi:hypothetical protein
MLLPSLGATLACVGVVCLLERRRLRGTYDPAVARAASRARLLPLAAAAGADWISPLVGVSPWLPVAAVAAVALALARRRPLVALPLRLGLQIGSLLVVLDALRQSLDLGSISVSSPSVAGLAVVAAAVTLGAAIANNLPASAAVATLLSAGPGSYAALLGLSAGALATPHGSVATLVSLDMSPEAPGRGAPLAWTAAALAAVAAGVILLRLTLA